MTGMDDHDFAMWDGSYVLGALSPEDRQLYEAHLQTCASCSASVRQLAGLPGLLARIPPADLLDTSEQPAVPETLLPALLRRVRRERRRRTWTAGLVAAVAASALTAIALLTGGSTGPPTAPTPPAGTALTALAADAPEATARLVDVAWGTRIELTCTYGTWVPEEREVLVLVVTDRSGRSDRVATWAETPGRAAHVEAATAVEHDDIASLEIRTAAGEPLLRRIL